MLEKLTERLDGLLDIGIPYFDIIVMKDGKCIYRHKNGFLDPEKTKPVTGKEKYFIYSCTKVLTCTAALQLYERGLFSLDDELSKFMPEFAEMKVLTKEGVRPAKRPILIRHLFNMTAGFGYNVNTPALLKCREETNGECPTREAMKYLAFGPLLFDPGEKWEYSLCHDVLAALVEVISGETFGEYVKKNIFEPLGMSNSSFLSPDPASIVANKYRCTDTGVREMEKKNELVIGSKYESGGAGCISTVEDYIKFAEALCHGDVILKNETVELMMQNQLDEKQILSFWERELYGYGLGVRCPVGKGRLDFGWGGAAGAHFAVDRTNKISVFFATHVRDFSSTMAIARSTTINQEIFLNPELKY